MLIDDFEKKLLLIHLQANNSHQVIDSIQTASKKPIAGPKEIKRTIREIRKLKIDDENILDDFLEENDDGEPHGIYKATSTTSTKSSRPTRKAAESPQIKYISDSAE